MHKVCVCVCACVCVCTCVLSRFSFVKLFATLWTVACQIPLSMGLSRQEYWSGLPCSPPGGRPNPGIEPLSHVSYIHRHGLFTTRKNLPAMQETQVQWLGQEDPLEKEMASHSSIRAWKIPWTEETGGLQSRVTKNKSWLREQAHSTIWEAFWP